MNLFYYCNGSLVFDNKIERKGTKAQSFFRAQLSKEQLQKAREEKRGLFFIKDL